MREQLICSLFLKRVTKWQFSHYLAPNTEAICALEYNVVEHLLWEVAGWSDLLVSRIGFNMAKQRCSWVGGQDAAYTAYHDKEWGVPVYDDRTHFEFLTLEGAQAGLSWATILKKRAGYKENFADFDVQKVARFTPTRLEKVLTDPGIVRNRLKVHSVVTNAKQFIAVQKEFGSFNRYLWGFVGGKPIVNRWKKNEQVPATSAESDLLSKDLKNRGFKFVGSTIMYAHMQATGLVNDHLTSCFRHSPCCKLARPSKAGK